MTEYQLKNINSEDLDEFLVKVENSFDIKFAGNELENVKNFRELCDYIANKIQLENSNDCTTQQAFYKLREAISETLQINNKEITPESSLADLLPKAIRRPTIMKLEKRLGFNLNILRPPHWLTGTFMILLLASFGYTFYNWQIGLLGLLYTIIALWLAHKIGNELMLQTVGEAAEKMTRENYLKSRRNAKTFNKKEIEKILTNWFIDELLLDKNKLTSGEEFV